MTDMENSDMGGRKRVLVVGAGGFIGGFIVGEGLRRGYDVYAGVRASTSRRYLSDERIRFVELDFDGDNEALAAALRGALTEGERWDYVAYNLGATKCNDFRDFNRINFDLMRRFVEALVDAGMMPEKFLYMSSLSALGPGDEKDYTPYTEKMVPDPNTRYGLSKIKSETWLTANPQVPWIIFRPTGVYGPHDRDYLMMVKAIDRHFDFGVGYRRQMLTFIYVEDLARAIYDALERSAIHETYIISEPRAYTQAEFRKIVAKALGRKFVIPVRLPLWAARVASSVSETIGKITMKPQTLNSDKYKIMRQRNWTCSVDHAVEGFGFAPQTDLRAGIAEVVRAYRAEKR